MDPAQPRRAAQRVAAFVTRAFSLAEEVRDRRMYPC